MLDLIYSDLLLLSNTHSLEKKAEINYAIFSILLDKIFFQVEHGKMNLYVVIEIN